MKHFKWAAPILFLMTSISALADSVVIGLGPNQGFGENFGYQQTGVGFSAGMFGGTPFFFFNDQGYAPGAVIGGTTDVFFDDAFLTVNGVSYSIDNLGIGVGTLFVSSFTLPTNGQDFSTLAQASFSGSLTILATGQTFNIGGSGSGIMSFTFLPSTGLYFANSVLFTGTAPPVIPEPGTLGFMVTGLVSIIAVAGKRLRC